MTGRAWRVFATRHTARFMGRFGSQMTVALITFIRLAVSTGTFMIIARALGPVDFGLVTTIFAYSSIAFLLTDYGFGVQSLRDVGAAQHRAGEIIESCLRGKTFLITVVSVLVMSIVSFLPISGQAKWAALGLFVATNLTSFGDLVLIAFRGLGAYRREANLVIWTSLLHAALIAVASRFGIGALSAAFLVSRLIYAHAALRAVSGVVPVKGIFRWRWAEISARLRSSGGLAIDTSLTIFSTQIDVILVGNLLGLQAVGLYQAGARLVQIAPTLSMVLASVHIPALARSRAAGDGTHRVHEFRIFVDYIGVAVLMTFGFVVLAPLVVTPLLGPAYRSVDQLWTGFGVYVAIHMAASAFGACLIVENAIRLRIVGVAVALATTIALFVVVLPGKGVTWAPWLLAGSESVKLVIYATGWTVRRMRRVAPSGQPA